MTKTTGELEREAERTREDLSATLDELRDRIEPGRLVDQAFSYARDNGGADFMRNAATQARDNPLPVFLIGAGLAWLMSGRKPATGPSAGTIHDVAMRRTHDAQDAASGVASAVGNAASALSDTVQGAFRSGKSGASHVGGKVGDMGAATSEGLRSGGARAQDAFGSVQSMFADNPVALGALGVAIGAAIGAALPTTETENRLLGEHADELKSTLKSKAEEGAELGKRAVSAGLEEARQDGGAEKPKTPPPA